MKKQLTVALGLAVLATPAFATKARLQSLGEDAYGSYYINDNRNIWLNPAQITNHKDLVTFEWGDSSGASNALPAELDRAASPRAEGGINKAYGNMVYGIHLGGASQTANALRIGSGVAVAEENNIDVFVGGDAGMKWGANLGYSSSADDETAGAEDETQESMRTRLGVIMGDTQAFANISLANEAEDATGNEFDGDLGYQVGVIHAWEGNTLFADYRSFDAEVDPAAAAKGDVSLSQILVGMGRVERLNDTSNLFAKIQYQMVDVDNEAVAGTLSAAGLCAGGVVTACEEYKSSSVPVVLGLETEATSWLTLRASISQTIWGTEEDKDNERPLRASTVVNAGATLKFGELSIDGVIGNNTGALDATNGNESTAAGNGTLRTDVLMTRVGMVYRF